MHILDYDRAFADRGGNAFCRSRSNITDGEDARL